MSTYWIGIPIEDFRCYANHLFLSSHYTSFILSSFEIILYSHIKPKKSRTVSGASSIISLYFPLQTLETRTISYNSTKRTVMLWVCIDILNSVSFHRCLLESYCCLIEYQQKYEEINSVLVYTMSVQAIEITRSYCWKISWTKIIIYCCKLL